jgi:cytochrome P450
MFSRINSPFGIKEALRMHPVLFTGAKQAFEDEVIPLSQPLKLPDGRSITEIPVSKGQNIWINIPGYNRLPGIFGENVHEFDIDRWLDGRLDDLPGLVGAYGNLATFGHGPHLCIGEHLPFDFPCAMCAYVLQGGNSVFSRHRQF